MFVRKKFDKTTGVYTSPDSVENFEISITLKKLYSLITIPKFDEKSIDHLTDDIDDVEDVSLRWQEKRLSQFEIDYYTSIENCKTDVQKKYNQIIINKRLKENSGKCKIFTYISDDNYNVEPNSLKFSSLRKNCENSTEISDEFISIKKSIICESEPTDELIKKRYKNVTNFETMYIMADLDEEVILFTIKWRSADRLLIIYPDFNEINTNPYFIEIDSDSRHMYHYGIKNLSKAVKNDWQLRELEMISKLSLLELTNKKNLFDLPPKRHAYIHFMFEIISADGFEYDNIHVRYTINKPVRFDVINGEIEGSTHSSMQKDNHWKIGHLHNLVIKFKFDENNLNFRQDSIQILYEIISIDRWGTERTEGRTFLNIPIQSGIFSDNLNCFREVYGNFVYDKFHRLLVGGRRQFNMIDFIGGVGRVVEEDEEEVSRLNRYGTVTKSTGSLNIKRQVVIQKHTDFTEDFRKQKKLIHSKIRKASNKIDEVLSTYRGAKNVLN